MAAENRTGPYTKPWGTPFATCKKAEVAPITYTDCLSLYIGGFQTRILLELKYQSYEEY